MSQRSDVAIGFTAFAAWMLILIGIFHVIDGLSAIFKDEFFVPVSGYLFKFDVTTWGWIHLIGGIIVILAGASLFSGAVWARTVAVIVAGASAIASFVYLPWYPIWAIIIIALDVTVIWALTAHGRDIQKMQRDFM
jgi:hypothetical protein